jgi:uncharacterized protein
MVSSSPATGVTASAPPERFQVLAIDGGGIRGLYSAAVLAAWEDDAGGTAIVDHFDLVVGTSTGGIIALALGAGMRPAQIVRLYGDNASTIFPHRRGLDRRGWLKPKFSPSGLAAVLERTIGDRQLWASQARLVVPAYNLTADSVYLFKTPHHPRLTRDWRCRMVDVALATSAAPTYLPAHHLGHVRLVDGGVWANNPVLIGIAEAVSLFGASLPAIRVLSLSTTSDLAHHDDVLDRGGRLQWALRGGLEVILRSQSVGANALAQHLVGTTNLVRIDDCVPKGIHRLDRVNATELLGLAESRSRDRMPLVRETFLGHRAAPFVPYHRPPTTETES